MGVSCEFMLLYSTFYYKLAIYALDIFKVNHVYHWIHTIEFHSQELATCNTYTVHTPTASTTFTTEIITWLCIQVEISVFVSALKCRGIVLEA